MTGRLRLGLATPAWITEWAIHRARRDVEDVEVRYVASRDTARAAAYASTYGVPCWGTWSELLASSEIDAAYIATPNAFHGRMAREALSAGKHVLCEKPLTLDPAVAREIDDLARREGLVFQEAYHYRAHPAVDAALRAVRAGCLGELREITVRYGWQLEAPGDIRRFAHLDGGALMDVGCYGLDLLTALGRGRPTHVSAEYARWAGGVDMESTIGLRYADGCWATVGASLAQAGFDCRARLTGVKGSMDLDDVFLPVRPGDPDMPVFRARFGDSVLRETLDGRSSYSWQLERFVRAIQAGERGADCAVVTRAELLNWCASRLQESEDESEPV